MQNKIIWELTWFTPLEYILPFWSIPFRKFRRVAPGNDCHIPRDFDICNWSRTKSFIALQKSMSYIEFTAWGIKGCFDDSRAVVSALTGTSSSDCHRVGEKLNSLFPVSLIWTSLWWNEKQLNHQHISVSDFIRDWR